MDKDKLQKLKEMMNLLNEGLTKSEFVKSFEAAMKHILALEKKVIEKNNKELESLKESFNKFQTSKGADFDEVKLGAKNFTDKLFKEQADNLNFLRDKARNVKNGKNGTDGKDGSDGKNGKDGKDGSPDTAGELADKLEMLEGKDRLDVSAIKGLEEFVKDITPVGRTPFGGSVVHKFIDDETPSGTQDGSNKAFLLSKAPIGLKLYRGGARQRITEDYTLSGKTVTFLVAPVVGEILLADYKYF